MKRSSIDCIENKDIRWQQRFVNFKKAIQQLDKFIVKGDLNDLEKQGIIKAFEYSYELGWKTLKDLLEHNGFVNLIGPKSVIEQSFQDGLIVDGKGWVRMHESRNLTSHTYNEETAQEIVDGIFADYYMLFVNLQKKLEKEKTKGNSGLF